MQYNPEMIAKYLWIALIAVLIITVVFVVFEPGKDTRSSCTGFQYFIFLNQKMSESEYSIQVLNGVGDIRIKSLSIDGVDVGLLAAPHVASGDSLILVSASDPNNRRVDEEFRNRMVISYDVIDGIQDNRDAAICTGRVQ